MTGLGKYLRMFARLRRAPGASWSATTLNRAPHKPLLLMAVMDLVARGVINTSFIDVRCDLIELNELFSGYWRRVVPINHTSSIAFPFSRLQNEPFWELILAGGGEITPVALNNKTSVNQLRAVAIGARMDDELYLLLQGPPTGSGLTYCHFPYVIRW